jgi:hypothetical protein
VVKQLQVERKLLTDDEIESCKNGYNTWAYIGDINNRPQLNCVFQSDDAQNEFLSNPKVRSKEEDAWCGIMPTFSLMIIIVVTIVIAHRSL